MRKWPYVTMCLLAALILVFQVQLDRAKGASSKSLRGLFIPPRPEIFKVVLMGYHMMAADLYWLDAIQYSSECISDHVPPEDLYPMVNFITDLDPRFCMSYYFTGVNMTVGNANPHHAVDLLEKGKNHCPENWQIPFTAGYIYYFDLDEPEKAAENLEESNRIKPNQNIALLAARMRAEGGSPEMGIRFLQQVIKTTEDEGAKRAYEERIRELQALIGERNLTELVHQYEQRMGRPAQSLDDLVRAGALRGIPKHPMPRHRFVLDVSTQTVKSDPPVVVKVYQPEQ